MTTAKSGMAFTRITPETVFDQDLINRAKDAALRNVPIAESPCHVEFDRICTALMQPIVPTVIIKNWPGIIAGNTDHLMLVAADKLGRLWREDKDKLTLVFNPAWVVGP